MRGGYCGLLLACCCWRIAYFAAIFCFSAYGGAGINITAIVMTIYVVRRSNSICPYHLSVVEARRPISEMKRD